MFASAAELQKTPPRPDTRVELRNVTLACTPKGHVVAVDDIPDALLAEGGALRAELEPLVPAYEEFEHDVSNPHTKTSLDAVKGDPRMPELVAKVAALKKLMKNPELSESTRQVWRAPRLLFASMLATRAKATFVKAKTWVAQIAADAAQRGVRVTGIPEDARTACRALDAVTFYAKGDPTIDDTDDLERLVNGFDAALRDLPMAFQSRPVVRGVLHSTRGGVAIAIDESYSTTVLLVQAASACLAGLTGILILASIVTLARRAPSPAASRPRCPTSPDRAAEHEARVCRRRRRLRHSPSGGDRGMRRHAYGAQRLILVAAVAGAGALSTGCASSSGGPNTNVTGAGGSGAAGTDGGASDAPASDAGNLAPVTLYLVGDSTVAAFNDPYYYPRYGYGTQIGKYLSPSVTVNNLALSGRSSKSYIDPADNGNYAMLMSGAQSGRLLDDRVRPQRRESRPVAVHQSEHRRRPTRRRSSTTSTRTTSSRHRRSARLRS